jgi:hypothetical protein
VSQLRVYRIAEGHLDDFVAEWRHAVLPLRDRFGFSGQAWTVRDEDMFVWLIRFDGEGTFADADRAYYASSERAALDPDPARWIVENTTLDLEPVAMGEEAPGSNDRR